MNLFQKKYNRETFVSFLSDSFLPEDFKIGFNEISLTRNQNFASKAFRLGECKSLGLEVFEIHHTSVNDARVGISKDAFQLLLHHSYCNRALIAFIPSNGNQWRFSLIQIEADINDVSGRITRGYTNPRRFSFLVGEDALVKTPTQFLIDKGRVRQRTEGKNQLTPLQDLQIRFSIEALTQEFYNKLYNWYLWAKDKRTGVTFPNNTDTQADDRDKLEVKMIRLITRMLFVWFIKQKQLVPDNLFDKEYMSQILRGFDPNAKDEGNYYNAILQNLFFATLNQEKEDRAFVHPVPHGRSESYSIKSLYRDNKKESWFNFPESEKEERVKELFEDIPYLNGGLFECLDKFRLDEDNKLVPATYYDGFSTKDTKLHGNFQYRAFVPNYLFFASEHSEIVTIREATDTKDEETLEIKVLGLLELFKQYNFTVEENTSSVKEVSLDPELLGRVFENLLAAYNPETQDTVRKSTGSFYTPREIVEYMVEDSLIDYLTKGCGNDDNEIKLLVKHDDASFVNNPQKIVSDLKKIKILDPACGSGAFPMGVLLKITDIIEKLTPKEEFNRYDTKLEIIKNCIYGIDIQAIAMLICKLRFFISLICDCDKDETKPNMGIIPLPNLETKFIAANSLLPAKVKQYNDDWTQDEHLRKLQKELLELRLNIFDLRTHKEKRNNKIADREKCREIETYIKQSAIKADETKIAKLQKAIAQYEAELPLYAEDYWVDESVTQQSLFGDETTLFRHNPNKEKREKLQALIKNAKTDIQKEKNKSIKPEFTKAIEEVTHWDPYDQNSVSPFFDAEWMFGIGYNSLVKHGFDIVIGNPPYIRVQSLSHELIDLYKSIYKTAFKRLDISTLFIEQMCKSLSENGLLCYIISNQFTSAEYGRLMRKYLVDNKLIDKVVDFADLPVFENAITYVSIFTLSKRSNDYFDYYRVPNLPFREPEEFSKCNYCDFDEEPWNFVFDEKKALMKKISSFPLLTEYAFAKGGIISGCDDCFLYNNDDFPAEKEVSLDVIRTDDIKRYYMGNAQLKVFYPCKMNDKGETVVMELQEIKENFPLAYNHIISNEVKLKQRKDSRTTMESKHFWYQPVRFGTLKLFCGEKILGPGIVCKNKFVLDEKGYAFSFGNMYAIVAKNSKIKMRVLLGILNSKLIEFFLHNTAPRKQGGYFSYGATVLEKIPIVYPGLKDESEIKCLVDSIIEKKKTRMEADTSIEERAIDKIIYRLYGLSELEAEIIDKIDS